jgi:hypothetical protein
MLGSWIRIRCLFFFLNTIFNCYADLFAKMCLVIVSFGHLHITDTFSSTGTGKFRVGEVISVSTKIRNQYRRVRVRGRGIFFWKKNLCLSSAMFYCVKWILQLVCIQFWIYVTCAWDCLRVWTLWSSVLLLYVVFFKKESKGAGSSWVFFFLKKTPRTD